MTMFETNARFHYKESKLWADKCVIQKVIKMTGTEFDIFSNSLLRDQDFIKANNDICGVDEHKKRYCILVVGEGKPDGILVDSSGFNYARYSAFIPNVESFLTTQRYPALAELNKKMTMMVDYIVEFGGAGSPDGRGIIDLQDSELTFGIDFMSNATLRSTVLAMLDERSEIQDWVLDGSQLIVWRDLGLDKPTPLDEPFQVFIINREKFDKGEEVGEWLTLPTSADTLHELFERIGIDKPSEGAFIISSVRMPLEEHLSDHISKYDSLDELNMLVSCLYDLEDEFENQYVFEKLQAILSSGVADIGTGVSALINLVDVNNFKDFDFIYAHDEEHLGRWYSDEEGGMPNCVSFAEYGKQRAKDEGGKFIPELDGYIKYLGEGKVITPVYTGVVPDKYKIVGTALRGLQPEKTERIPNTKPSVVDEIRASQQSLSKPKENNEQQLESKTKKRSGEHDL